MSSLTKLLSILDYFGPDCAALSADEIIARLGCSRPQGYRYIRELCTAGLLTRFSGAYSLGPRISELDYIIRSGDPLLECSEALVKELCQRLRADVLVVNIFGDRVVAIHHERCDNSNFVGWGRGQPLPLFAGAGSKMILASLPVARQRRLFEQYPKAVESAGWGRNWEEFRSELRNIRRAGYALSFGELDKTNVGIAAPVVHEPGVPPAVLIVVMPRERYDAADPKAVAQAVKDAAAAISARSQARRELAANSPVSEGAQGR